MSDPPDLDRVRHEYINAGALRTHVALAGPEEAPGTVRRLKETAKADLMIGGANLAGQALILGLVDECHLFLGPIVVGGGKRALPGNIRAELELLDERRFRNGVVHLRYRVIV